MTKINFIQIIKTSYFDFFGKRPKIIIIYLFEKVNVFLSYFFKNNKILHLDFFKKTYNKNISPLFKAKSNIKFKFVRFTHKI